jgi:hypothetical protein
MTIPSPSRVALPEVQEIPADPNTRITSLEEVIKRISESMEAMKKTNEDLASSYLSGNNQGMKKGVNQ